MTMVVKNSLDALIVGAGFGGLHMLHRLRKEGFKAKVYEAGSGIGGTWFWNCYPGARVDSEHTYYQFTQDEIWKGFQWTQRFPGQKEILQYLDYVDKKLNLSVDITFNTRVISAEFNNTRNQWLVKVKKEGKGNTLLNEEEHDDDSLIWANQLILCTGFAERRYTPDFKGLQDFKGKWYHTSLWPKDGVNLKGKHVAVIGTGASGVQVIQEIGPEVKHLTVYQRTPNIALPMNQCNIVDQQKWKFPQGEELQNIFKVIRTTFAGFGLGFIESNGADVTSEERRAVCEDLFPKGGFAIYIGNYQDLIIDQETNDDTYQFWCEKTRLRIKDPVKKDLLAPKVPPHAFGAKRPSLEQRYYEVFNQDNVDLIDVRKSPIIEITENGIRTQEEGETNVDFIVFATGFDSLTGGILNIQITNGEGDTLQEKWKEGTWTQLGLSIGGFPNLFFLYGPQAPTAFSNGPTTIEIQGAWIRDLLVNMRETGKKKVVPTKEAEETWKKGLTDIWNATLLPGAESWYQGSNIPGKPIEPLNFAGGIPAYTTALEDCAKNNYEGFIFS